MVTNLVSNALKYAPGSPIEVTVERQGQLAVLTVRDSGPGIRPDRLPRIFERFERVGAGSTTSGLGLGLYITREIVRAHGGSVAVESEPEKGCVFLIELPLEPPGG